MKQTKKMKTTEQLSVNEMTFIKGVTSSKS